MPGAQSLRASLIKLYILPSLFVSIGKLLHFVYTAQSGDSDITISCGTANYEVCASKEQRERK